MANKLRSAIHYPHSSIQSVNTMKEALLLWDKIHVIGPYPQFEPRHQGEIAEAWKMIGRVTIPGRDEKRLAHDDILNFLANRGRLPPKFFLKAEQADGIYDIYDQKLLAETWRELERAGFAGDIVRDADRPLTTWGGLIIMAKLADACAGDLYARVTDRTAAYRAIANELEPVRTPEQDAATAVPVLLSLIDATSLPFENLMHFRDRERDPTLRYQLLDTVNDHIEALGKVRSVNQMNELQEQFETRMRQNLKDLRDALRWNKIRFAVSASVLTFLSGAIAAAAHFYKGPLNIGAALAAGSAGGLGARQVTDLFGAGLALSERQRATLAKHPMAYMHMLSEHRISTARVARSRRV